MRKAILMLSFLAALFVSSAASQTYTEISGTLTRADSTTVTGYVTISWSKYVDANGAEKPGGSMNVYVPTGAIDVKLPPSAIATPPIIYQIAGTNYFDLWYVPVSATTVTLTAVRTLASGGSVTQGTSLPATCNVGQQFFKTDASAGQNLYGCTSANTWTLQGGTTPPTVKEFVPRCQSGTAAAPFDLPSTGAPGAVCRTGTDTPASVGATVDFTDDGTTVISVQGWFTLPDAVTTVSLTGKWASAVADNTKNVVWQIQTKCVADGEVFDGGAWNAAQTITEANKGTANQSNDFSLTPVTITGCAAGERFKFYFFRDPAHASDTLAATASLISLKFSIQ